MQNPATLLPNNKISVQYRLIQDFEEEDSLPHFMASLQYFKYSVMTQCAAVKNQGKGLASS